MIRNHGYWVLSSVCGKSFSDSMTPTDLIPFEWDEQPEPVEMSDDEYQRLKAAIEAENKKD